MKNLYETLLRTSDGRKAIRIRALLGCLILCLLPQMVLSQQATKQEDVDEDERLDTTLRKFGHVSGQAFQCQPKEQRMKLERRALDVGNGILRLFGSDRAFYFAAAFGAGASEQIDQNKCPDVVKQQQEMASKLKALAR